MVNKKRMSAFILMFIFVLNILPINIVLADEDNIHIISSTNITVQDAKEWAKSKNATEKFIELSDLFWKYSKSHGNVNPAIAYAQSAKETGYGNFGGVIDETYYNTCGLKTTKGGDDLDPDAHQRFESWEEGVQAHLDHLALYAGADGYPRSNTRDPRHFESIKGKATTVNELGGKWAPSIAYGKEIYAMYNEMGNVFYFPMRDAIDSPRESDIVEEDTMTAYGWALNGSGIKEVKAFIDGKEQEDVRIGISRPDVNSAFPGYPNGNNSGFEVEVDLRDLHPGRHTFKIESIGNDGTISVRERQFSYKLDINNFPMRDAIDSPRESDIVEEDTMTAYGWALNGSGIKEVKAFIDGKEQENVRIGISRPDVNSAFPGYPNGNNSGFEVEVDLRDLHPGRHTFKIESIGNDGTISIREREFSYKSKNMLIVIDAGHGGSDGGSYSNHNGMGYSEADLNLKIAIKTKNTLQSLGYTVIMTRIGNETVTLQERSRLANNMNADLFISIHQNSFFDSSVNGTEVFYNGKYSPDLGFPIHNQNKDNLSKKLAHNLVDKLSKSLNIKNRGAKNNSNLSVLRNTKMPSILVECVFISNSQGAEKIAQPSSQQSVADSISRAIEEIF